jgi:hypothetical protein
MKLIITGLLLAGFISAVQGETISGLCMVSVSQGRTKDAGRAEVMLRSTDCGGESGHCDSSNDSDISWNRWTGVSPDALRQEGAQITAHMDGDAGDLKCSGTVHDGVLAGRYEFTPAAGFNQKMTAMGFDGITARKSEGFLMLDVTTAWVKQMKDAGVTELSTNKLMGLKALRVDLDYIHGMAAAGYPELRANKLTEMKAVGVTPEKAQEAKSLGFQPTEQELTQMSIFKIDRPFVERMRARGLKDLTLASLIKIKIFKLED